MAQNEAAAPSGSSISPALAEAEVPRQTSAVETVALELGPLPEGDDEVEADDDNNSESGYGSSVHSGSTSVTSSIHAGYEENGRRYQTTREGYWGPSDEKQFEQMSTGHIVYQILESQHKNRFFRSPISEKAQNILDIGTGDGSWARDVADLLPAAVVLGIDLYPPPETWVPPNCHFVVEDVLTTWEYTQKFDLIHLRVLVAAFEAKQWHGVYKQAYQNLAPGGWIEHHDCKAVFYSDDGTLPLDSALAKWGGLIEACCSRSGRDPFTINTMRQKIEDAGFKNVHEKVYKVPFGEWAKHPLLKEAGKFNRMQFMEGLEGFAMFLLTHFGVPEPWTPAEVQVFLVQMRKDLNNPAYHAYQFHKRVWAQKPFDAEPAATKAEHEVVDVSQVTKA